MNTATIRNVNEIADRFTPEDFRNQGGVDDPPYWTPNHDGMLEAQAACGKHYGWYDQAAIIVGDLPCPHGTCRTTTVAA